MLARARALFPSRIYIIYIIIFFFNLLVKNILLWVGGLCFGFVLSFFVQEKCKRERKEVGAHLKETLTLSAINLEEQRCYIRQAPNVSNCFCVISCLFALVHKYLCALQI